MYILIVNEDPLGRTLAAELVARGHEVAYLDDNPEYCQMVATEVGCLVVQGETTNIRVLREAGIDRADVVVTLLEKDIKNIMVGLFARQFQRPLILAWLRQHHYQSAYELAGITNIFSSFDYLLNKFLIAIEQPNVRHVMALGDGRVEIAAIVVLPVSPLVRHDLKELWENRTFPPRALVLGLLKVENQSFHLPRDRETVAVGDEILVVAPPDDIERIDQIINRPRRSLFRS